MLPLELRDSSLIGVVNVDSNARILVHPFSPYVNLETQRYQQARRGGIAEGWVTTGVGDFVDVIPQYIKALQEARDKQLQEQQTE